MTDWHIDVGAHHVPAARCNVVALRDPDGQPSKTIDGRQWYGCLACERSFTEACPTVVPSICLREES